MSEADGLDPLLFLMLEDDNEGLSGSERRRLAALRALLEQRYGSAAKFAEAQRRWELGQERIDPEYEELRRLEVKARGGNHG